MRNFPSEKTTLSQNFSNLQWLNPQHLIYLLHQNNQKNLVSHNIENGLITNLLPPSTPSPRGTVGYGHNEVICKQDQITFAGQDRRLHHLHTKEHRLNTITPAYKGLTLGDISPCQNLIAFSAEENNSCNILVVNLKLHSLQNLTTQQWYAINPKFSVDSQKISWQQWNPDSMPWHKCEIVIMDLSSGEKTKIYNKHNTPSSYTHPQFSPCGKYLSYLSDIDGHRQIYIADINGKNPKVLPSPNEIGCPDWVPGLKHYTWANDSKAIYAIHQKGPQAEILKIQLEKDSSPINIPLNLPYTAFSDLSLNPNNQKLACIASSPSSPSEIISISNLNSPQNPKVHTHATSSFGAFSYHKLKHPEIIHWQNEEDQTISGIFYQAQESSHHSLIVQIHGGPTDSAKLNWHPQAHFFNSHGYHYLRVNHRGSSGFGRSFQEALNNNWGVYDCDDAKSGAEHLCHQNICNPKKLIITGGSAGGYTTIQSLVRHNAFWAAGISLFGISDQYELTKNCHRFEKNYPHLLLGQLEEQAHTWFERSPIHYAHKIKSPLLLLHGEKDQAVPISQSKELVIKIKQSGGTAELITFPEEGHGFRIPANQIKTLEKSLEFINKYVRYQQ